MNIEEFLEVKGRFAPWHVARYTRSLEWLDPYLIARARVIDLGGRSAFTDALKKFFDLQIETDVVPDLRYRFPAPDDHFDLALCMEVLEHICDRGDSRVDIFTGSGIKSVISETFRVLRSGGHLFLTTPSVCCYNSVWRMLQGKHPFSYQPHFRELASADVVGYLEHAGFEVERHEVLDIWQGHKVPESAIEKINEISAELGCDVPRGDCIFVLARKG